MAQLVEWLLPLYQLCGSGQFLFAVNVNLLTLRFSNRAKDGGSEREKVD